MPENRRAHIAFMAAPAHGHVNPGLGLVAELVARGHRVTYATTADFEPQIADAGATPVLYESLLPRDAAREQWPTDQASAVGLFVDEMIAVHPQLVAAYAEDEPDLVIYDIGGMQAPVLAKQWGIPAVCLSPTHVAFEGFEEEFGWEESPAMSEVRARADEFFAEQGVDLTFATMSPECCVVTIPRSFQYRGDTVGDNYTFVGPMLTDRAFQGRWERPDDKPVLLISLGSAFTDQLELYRACLEAYGGLDWHVVLTIGKVVDPGELGAIPPNFEVHRWVPQLDVLARASAFLTHAGMGGVTEGMYFGVPMIAVPQAADQFANAARLDELGLGVHLPAQQATPVALRAALERVSSDAGLAARLRSMHREIHESGGVRTAVEVVERRLG